MLTIRKNQLDQIKTGDNLLVSSHSWLGKTIQRFQKCAYNHSAMFWWSYDELMVIEADRRGICITPFSDYINSDKDLLILRPQFPVDGSEYGKFMLPYAGHTRYGYFNLICAQAVKYLTNGRIWLGPQNDENTKTFICGEFVAFVYNHFQPWIFEDWSRLAPADIYNHPSFLHFKFIK